MQVTAHMQIMDGDRTPHWEEGIDVFELSGGRSQTPGTASHEARRQCFLC
jgi:hypothetical protein